MSEVPIDPVESALALLTHNNPALRKSAAQSLLYRRPLTASHRIQQIFVRESDPVVSKWLALLLARLGDRSALPLLEERLKSTESQDTRDWIRVSQRLLREGNCQAEINQLLASKSDDISADAAILMWDNPGITPEQTGRLIHLDSLDDPRARRWRMLALGTLQINDYTPIHLALQDDDFRVREYAAWAIAQHRDESALPRLVYSLSDQEPRVREWALKAISALRHAESMALLLAHYPEEPDPECREGVIRGLEPYVGDQRVKQFVLQTMHQEHSPLILSGLFTLVARNEDLRDDPEILAATISRATQSSDQLLIDGLKSELYSALPERERQTLETVIDNPSLARISSFIGDTHKQSVKGRPILTNPDRITVAIVIALPEELSYFLDALADVGVSPQEHFDFPVYHVRLPVGTPRVFADCYVSTTDQPGTERAALRARDLLSTFEPHVLANIGLAGALCDDVWLGDVVIATQLDNYLHDAKAVDVPGKEQFSLLGSHDAFKPDHNLAVRANHLQFAHREDYAKWQRCVTLPDNEVTRLLREKGLLREVPHGVTGHLASGPAVAAGTVFTDWLRTRDRKYLAVDMEAAGVGLAEHVSSARARVIVLRAISDLADDRKRQFDRIGGGLLRRFAMDNATRYLRLLLTHAPAEWFL